MIERIDDVPAGVIGLRASGKLTKDDYRNVLEPALKEATDSGQARVLFVLTDFDGLEARSLDRGRKDRVPGRDPEALRLEEARVRQRRRLGDEGDAPVRLGDARRARCL
jgi:hypothetical protein